MEDSAASTRPPCTREDALAVLRRLREAGHVAYFAGGCVRDLLLGKEPKDYDIATDAPPQRVRELFSNTQAVGAAFGVILVRHRKSQVEVATFRTDVDYKDGRHPTSVRFATAEEDARRRDFTINGLFLDPLTNQVIDYVGGQEDLKAGQIRAIGDPAHRFEEDSLRLLRAVRFSARFGFPIEPVTRSAIIQHAPQLKRISPERIAEELRIMLTPPTRPAAWRLLWELKLIEVIFRFIDVTPRGERASGPFLLEQVAPGEPIPLGLALAAATLCYRMQLAADLPRISELASKAAVIRDVKAMRHALKISNEESEQMRGTLAGIHPLLQDRPPGVAQMKGFLAQPTAALSRKLLDALATVGVESARIQWLRTRLAELEQTDFAPEPLLSGDTLIALGLTPGPLFKLILNEIYDAQLEGRVSSQQQAASLALEIAQRAERDRASTPESHT